MSLDFGKQIGPLPLGAWLAVVGTGLGIAYYTRGSSPGGDVEPEIPPEEGGGVPGVGTGPGWIAVPPPSAGPNTQDPTTNEEWARLAINYLIAQGYDPILSDSALRKYIAAEQLSVREYALVRIALAKFGSPPTPLPPGPDIPTPRITPPPPKTRKPPKKVFPAPKPKPVPKPRVRYHIVKPGETLSKLAQRYYRNPREWTRIYNANRRLIGNNPNSIRVGWRLVIP